jgi:phage shock protein A
MAKQSIIGRITQLAKANINALIDQAEDPQLMLDQLVRDYSDNIADAESAIAQTIGNLRLLEDDHREDVQTADDWGRKALAASQKGDELRAAGNTLDADKFDSLAKVALTRQLQSENEARDAEPSIASQTEVVEKLKSGLNSMKEKLGELTRKRDELAARAKTVEAQGKVQDALKSINVLDPTSDLGRGRADGLEPRRAVREPRRPRRTHRGRRPAGRAEGQDGRAPSHRRTGGVTRGVED